MTRNQGIFAALYAGALQWHEVPRVLGVPIDGGMAMLVFIALWAVSAVCGLALNLRWRGLMFAFGSIFIVTLSVTVGIWLADIGSHSRDVPLWWLLIAALIFAAVACSGLLLAVAARSFHQRLN